jgi:hypothetical protein
MADNNWWENDAFATAADVTASTSGGRAKTTDVDRKEALAARKISAAERDSQRVYQDMGRAVDTFGTGPNWASYVDAITPSPDDGLITAALKGTVGAAARAVSISRPVAEARTRIDTARAKLTVLGDKSMKGVLTDKDTALLRLSGIDTYKPPAENHRVIREAQRDSEVRQARALMTDRWISKFGSLTAAAPNGMTFEDAQMRAEKDLLRNHWAPKPSTLPKAPPSTRKKAGKGLVVIDIHGNPVR